MQEFDVIVIGGGSAGLKTGRITASAGLKVAVIEEKELGGECFWAGCVPTKAMVRAANVWELARNASRFGIHIKIEKADYSGAMAYKNNVVKQVSGEGPADGGLSRIGAAYFHTTGRFESANEVRVGGEVIRGKQIVIATGTVPAVPPIPGLVEAGYITNREAVDLSALPKSMVVLGAGPIGLEFAQVFRRFGSEVTVIEMAPQILPREDEDIARLAEQYLKDNGIKILTSSTATQVSKNGNLKTVHYRKGNETGTVQCETILVAAGRRAALDNLNIGATGVNHNRREVNKPSTMQTNIPHIWIAGDAGGGFLFTHVAAYEGRITAQNILQANQNLPLKHCDWRVIPRCTYIDPEVSSVGFTEGEARRAGIPVTVASFSFADLDRAVLHGEPKGMVKLVADARDKQIVGAHLIGYDSSSILSEIVVVMQNRLPYTAISDAMHAYPSFPEAVEAAALSFD